MFSGKCDVVKHENLKKKSLYSLNYTNNKKKEVSRTTTIILNSLLAHFSKLKVDVHLVLKKKFHD